MAAKLGQLQMPDGFTPYQRKVWEDLWPLIRQYPFHEIRCFRQSVHQPFHTWEFLLRVVEYDGHDYAEIVDEHAPIGAFFREYAKRWAFPQFQTGMVNYDLEVADDGQTGILMTFAVNVPLVSPLQRIVHDVLDRMEAMLPAGTQYETTRTKNNVKPPADVVIQVNPPKPLVMKDDRVSVFVNDWLQDYGFQTLVCNDSFSVLIPKERTGL